MGCSQKVTNFILFSESEHYHVQLILNIHSCISINFSRANRNKRYRLCIHEPRHIQRRNLSLDYYKQWFQRRRIRICLRHRSCDWTSHEETHDTEDGWWRLFSLFERASIIQQHSSGVDVLSFGQRRGLASSRSGRHGGTGGEFRDWEGMLWECCVVGLRKLVIMSFIGDIDLFRYHVSFV